MSEITVINQDYPNAIQPDDILITLKEHQLKLLNKCLDLENNTYIDYDNDGDKKVFMIDTKIGVIGDKVGCHEINTKILMYDGQLKWSKILN